MRKHLNGWVWLVPLRRYAGLVCLRGTGFSVASSVLFGCDRQLAIRPGGVDAFDVQAASL